MGGQSSGIGWVGVLSHAVQDLLKTSLHSIQSNLKLVSTTQPSESDSFKGDGEQPDWRRGGSPASPSDVEWLCSESGGPASGG
jgi:hypothetical protein